jgi:ribosome biogenesis GTPase A
VLPHAAAGKSELINSLLGRPVLSTSAFRDSTKRIRVVKGNVAGEA